MGLADASANYRRNIGPGRQIPFLVEAPFRKTDGNSRRSGVARSWGAPLLEAVRIPKSRFPYLLGRSPDVESVESDFQIPRFVSGQLANPPVDTTSTDAWANRRRPTREQTGLGRHARAAEFWTPFLAGTLCETANGNVGRSSAAKSRNLPWRP